MFSKYGCTYTVISVSVISFLKASSSGSITHNLVLSVRHLTQMNSQPPPDSFSL